MILKIIEEFSDGFIILDEQGGVIFFNDVLMRITGWKSKDILADNSFLQHLGADKCRHFERLTTIPDTRGKAGYFRVTAFTIEGEDQNYTLVRVRQDLSSRPAEALSAQDSYEMLFHNIGDGILTVNLNGRLINANPAFYQLLGLEPGSAVKDISSLYVYKEELEDKLIRLLESDFVFNLETHLYAQDRTIKRVLDSSWVIRDARAVVSGYTCQLKDVSYLKNLEARLLISERNYALLFDTILSSIIIVDPLGRIVNCNCTARELYGYGWEEMAGQYYDNLFRQDKSRPTISHIFELVDGNGGRYIEAEVPRRRRDGIDIHTYCSYSSIRNLCGEIIAYSIIEKDLTERVNLERKLKESVEKIKQTQSAAILGFARLTEYRDKNTGKHLKRIREYTKVLATSLRSQAAYRDYITDRYIEDLCLSAVLHDVGKVAIEDAILRKTGKLDERESLRIKDHARLGGDALRDVDLEIKQQSFLTLGKEIAYYHHERWDGAGYPEGRKGEQIPLSARIVAVADVYDALTSNRPYKQAVSHEEAVDTIARGRGTQFDPEVVDAFVANQEAFRIIRLFHEFEENPQTIDALLQAHGKSTGATAAASKG